MSLTNPISPQNIVDRFAAYVVATANAGIVWHTGNNPTLTPPSGTEEVILDGSFGGTNAGLTINITGANIKAAGTDVITAANIYSTLVSQTNRYTRIRRVRAIFLRENDTATPTSIYDQTNVAHMAAGITSATQGSVVPGTDKAVLTTRASETITIGPAADYSLTSGSVISDENLETFFTALRDAYNTLCRGTTVPVITRTVCHSSCHSSCHTSRTRR